MEEYNHCTHFSATPVDPHDPSFSAQEDELLKTGGLLRERPEEFRGRIVTGMHMNPCKSSQECGDRNLEHVLKPLKILCPVLWGKPPPERLQVM